eukprot:scaffold27698_cov78-Phaeocystis_antarctica.AAC.1
MTTVRLLARILRPRMSPAPWKLPHLLYHDDMLYLLTRRGGVPTRHTHKWDGLPTRHLRERTHTNTNKHTETHRNTQRGPTKSRAGSRVFDALVYVDVSLPKQVGRRTLAGRDGTAAKLNSRCKRRVADLNLLPTSFAPATIQPPALFLARLSRSRRWKPIFADLVNIGFDELLHQLPPVVCVPHKGAVHLNMALRAKG